MLGIAQGPLEALALELRVVGPKNRGVDPGT